MSGGSLEYASFKINDIIRMLEEQKNNSKLRKEFIEHLKLISQALYDIEWVDSGDYSEGAEIKAIKKCLNKE